MEQNRLEERFKVVAVNNITPLRVHILKALGEIAERSGGRWPVEREYAYIARAIHNPEVFALWVCFDNQAETIQPCGVLTLEVGADALGTPAAYLSRGWISKGYRHEPFDVAMPHAIEWARERGCKRICTMTERTCAAAGEDRLTMKWIRKRWLPLMAYARWVNRHGFTMRETIFEREI